MQFIQPVSIPAARQLVCAAALLWALVLPARGSWAKLPKVEMFGNQYVKLADWADCFNFKSQWTRGNEEFTVTSRWSRLVFKVDSREAEINDVIVHLSVPIARRGAEAYIAPRDLETAVHPVMFPPRNAAGRKVRTICIDPGHGGRDPGNTEGRRHEETYTLLLAKELEKQLKSAGFRVCLTRTSDTYLGLIDRTAYASKHRADLFISLHYNAVDQSSVKGLEVYCLTPAYASSTNARGEGSNTGAYKANANDEFNMHLAWKIQQELVSDLKATDRGVRRARFAVLKYAAMPAVLIEGGFMTNPTDAKNIYDSSYRQKMAKAIVQGVQSYKKAVER